LGRRKKAIDNHSIKDYSISNEWMQDHYTSNNPGQNHRIDGGHPSGQAGFMPQGRMKSPRFALGSDPNER
jgi:hypothetical protein